MAGVEDIRITVTYRCPHCKGDKIVQHYAWSEFWQTHDPKGIIKDGELEKWFSDRGYSVWYRGLYNDRIQGLPPEEIPCFECEGSGRLSKEITIDNLAMLLIGKV